MCIPPLITIIEITLQNHSIIIPQLLLPVITFFSNLAQKPEELAVSPCCAFNRTYGGVAALGIDDHRRIQGEPHAVTYSSLLALEYILCIAGGIQIQPGWTQGGHMLVTVQNGLIFQQGRSTITLSILTSYTVNT